jgi:hypothetical protein
LFGTNKPNNTQTSSEHSTTTRTTASMTPSTQRHINQQITFTIPNTPQYQYKDQQNIKKQQTSRHKKHSCLKNVKIKVCTYNINNRRGECLLTAVCAMADMKMDLTETKLQDGIHAKYYQGYQIEATNARSKQQGAIALIWKEGNNHGIKRILHHGNGVLSFKLATGSFRWLIIGAYISPKLDGIEECNNILQAQQQRL